MLGSVAIFALSPVLCALSTAIAPLIGFRAIQGVAAGIFTRVAMGLVSDTYPANQDGMIALLLTVFRSGPWSVPRWAVAVALSGLGIGNRGTCIK